MSLPVLRFREGDVIAMRRRLTILADVAAEEFAEAAFEEYKIEAKEARRITPVDTGSLRETVEAFEPEIHSKIIYAGLQAGGDDVNYAVYVHEDMEAFHPVGQAKYLATPLFASGPDMPRRIGARIDFGKYI